MADISNEQWLPIPGYEGIYSVSNLGRIRTHKRSVERGNSFLTVPDKIMKTPSDGKGYAHFNARKEGKTKTLWVHICVAAAFKGKRPEGYDVRHLDGNPANNAIQNLEYGTRVQNINDSIKHGTHLFGAKKKNAKLSDSEAIAISQSNDTCAQLAVTYNVSAGTIHAIRSGRAWGIVTKNFRKDTYRRPAGNHKLSPEDVRKIFESEQSQVALAKLYNVEKNTIYRIKRGLAWQFITRV